MDLEELEIVCTGDFSCNWFRQNDKIQTKKLVKLTETLQLEQIINEPIRITENSQTLIDLFFTNRPVNIIKSGVDHIGISDHSLIYISTRRYLFSQ